MSDSIFEPYVPYVPPPENATYPPPHKPEDDAHKPLDDFVCKKPALRFINKRKYNETAQQCAAALELLRKYHPVDHFSNINDSSLVLRAKDDNQHESASSEEANCDAQNSALGHLLKQQPACAPQKEIQDFPDDAEFQKMMRRHADERYKMAYDFRKEQSHILSNYYDAQVRENMQKNEMIDHRPLSDALRYIAKRTAYPIDLGTQRFYKYNIRYEKIIKKHKKNMERQHMIQENRANVLHQKQLKDVQAFGNIHHIDVNSIQVPKILPPECE